MKESVRWKVSNARSTGVEFKLLYHGLDRKRYWVMVIFKEEEYVNSVVEVTKVSDRDMSLKLEVEGVLSVCMAQKMDTNRKRERNYGVIWTGEQNRE